MRTAPAALVGDARFAFDCDHTLCGDDVEESAEIVDTEALGRCSELDQLAQVGVPAPAVGAGQDPLCIAGLVDCRLDRFDDRGVACQCRHPAHEVHGAGAAGVAVEQHGFPHGARGAAQPEQVAGLQLDVRRCQHGQGGAVVEVVSRQRQQGGDVAHLRLPPVAAGGGPHGWDTALGECQLECTRVGLAGQQDGDLAWIRSAADQLGDLVGGDTDLCGAAAAGNRSHYDGFDHRAVGADGIGEARVDRQVLLAECVGEGMVDDAQECRGGTEVVAHGDRGGAQCRGPCAEDRDVCLAKSVDALPLVTDGEGAALAETVEQGALELVGVLELVDQQALHATAQFQGDGLVVEHGAGPVLELVEVGPARAQTLERIGLLEVAQEGEQHRRIAPFGSGRGAVVKMHGAVDALAGGLVEHVQRRQVGRNARLAIAGEQLEVVGALSCVRRESLPWRWHAGMPPGLRRARQSLDRPPRAHPIGAGSVRRRPWIVPGSRHARAGRPDLCGLAVGEADERRARESPGRRLLGEGHCHDGVQA